MEKLIEGINCRYDVLQQTKKVATDICLKINKEAKCKVDIDIEGMDIILKIDGLGIEAKINTKMLLRKTDAEIESKLIVELFKKIN